MSSKHAHRLQNGASLVKDARNIHIFEKLFTCVGQSSAVYDPHLTSYGLTAQHALLQLCLRWNEERTKAHGEASSYRCRFQHATALETTALHVTATRRIDVKWHAGLRYACTSV